jgi:predicted nucleic acid-binding protein
MKLDELLGGSVYIDANVPYMYLRADPIHLPTIRTFLERVVAGEVEAFIGILALDELYYRLLLSRVKETTTLGRKSAYHSMSSLKRETPVFTAGWPVFEW